MSKITNESRRAITEDEKQRGLEWLKNNGFAFESLCNGKLEFYSKRQGEFTILVLNPLNVWSAHIYDSQRNELAYNFGDFTECEEAVSNALEEAGANHLLDVIFCGKKQ